MSTTKTGEPTHAIVIVQLTADEAVGVRKEVAFFGKVKGMPEGPPEVVFEIELKTGLPKLSAVIQAAEAGSRKYRVMFVENPQWIGAERATDPGMV